MTGIPVSSIVKQQPPYCHEMLVFAVSEGCSEHVAQPDVDLHAVLSLKKEVLKERDVASRWTSF
jgi:hypothetical protein